MCVIPYKGQLLEHWIEVLIVSVCLKYVVHVLHNCVHILNFW
jgi:hypothetical protein